MIGPNKHKLDHLQEEDDEDDEHMEEQETFLNQSTYFKDRVFLSSANERALVLKLVSGEVDMISFLASDMTSQNGHLIKDLIEMIEDSFAILPEEYSRLIKNICNRDGKSELKSTDTNLAPKKLAPKTRKLRHFPICDKTL